MSLKTNFCLMMPVERGMVLRAMREMAPEATEEAEPNGARFQMPWSSPPRRGGASDRDWRRCAAPRTADCKQPRCERSAGACNTGMEFERSSCGGGFAVWGARG